MRRDRHIVIGFTRRLRREKENQERGGHQERDRETEESGEGRGPHRKTKDDRESKVEEMKIDQEGGRRSHREETRKEIVAEERERGED